MDTVVNCFDLNQALGFKTMLEGAGIPAFIPDEISAGIAPNQFLTDSGVRLQVAEENLEEAKRIIASVR
ncbi:MAG: DUF2007 domain-containing protein [Verrucomicrobiota bacterium]|nr:DUF2007 domain-containing protein [Verrucomicrobiota bacterium]